jgi:hypothetical protein
MVSHGSEAGERRILVAREGGDARTKNLAEKIEALRQKRGRSVTKASYLDFFAKATSAARAAR